MNPSDESEEPGGIPRLVAATVRMDDTVEVIRRYTLRTFPGLSEADPHWIAWDMAEEACRDRCEAAIRYWLERGILPILADDEAYFLRLRFDHASQFLQKLFLKDWTSVFSFPGHSLDAVLWWSLVDWWESHGAAEAFLEDLMMEEEKDN